MCACVCVCVHVCVLYAFLQCILLSFSFHGKGFLGFVVWNLWNQVNWLNLYNYFGTLAFIIYLIKILTSSFPFKNRNKDNIYKSTDIFTTLYGCKMYKGCFVTLTPAGVDVTLCLQLKIFYVEPINCFQSIRILQQYILSRTKANPINLQVLLKKQNMLHFIIICLNYV